MSIARRRTGGTMRAASLVVFTCGVLAGRTAWAESTQCDAMEAFMIAGYPEYSTDVKDLAAEQQKVFKDLAKRIVDSHATNTPYVAFMVVGHADVALRK